MKRLFILMMNTLFFTAVLLLALAVSTLALTKKVNEQRARYNQKISGQVVKDSVPIVSLSRGVIKQIRVKPGDEVKKGDVLIEIDNPVLRAKIDALTNYPDNVSAQTEARVAEEELKQLMVSSPVNGMVSDIAVSEGTPVENFVKLVTIIADDNTRMLVPLNVDQYLAVKRVKELLAYSERLNQTFPIRPSGLKPDQIEDQATQTKQIGMYFTFTNPTDTKSLLANEDLSLVLLTSDAETIRPIDYFVDFWNNLIYQEQRGVAGISTIRDQ